MEDRVVADCRAMPSEKGCTLTISGREEEVVEAATQHAVAVHGHTDSPQLREAIRNSLQPEQAPSWSPAGRIDSGGRRKESSETGARH